jgi:tetratricopeptide (TPR) repeat protein
MAAESPALTEGVALYRAKRFSEAKAVLEPAAAADPANAAVCYYLGMSILKAGGEGARDRAEPWLERAAKAEPGNARYLSDFAGTCLELADEHHSLSFATRGRDGMEEAIGLDPTDLAARDGLMQFYAKAPWPLEDLEKAWAQAAEIARRNGARGAKAYLELGRILSRKSNRLQARKAYEAALQLDPANREAAQSLSGSPPKN